VLFNSTTYFIFLSIVFCLYWWVGSKSLKWQNALLLVASYFFYGWWSWKFLFLLFGGSLMDYLLGFGVGSSQKNKAKLFLWISVAANLSILGLFKYYNFFALEWQVGLDYLGVHAQPKLLEIALPLGISFYTFHHLSYLIDIYRGQRKPVTSFIDYGVFVSFFPLLIAGPIERANHLLPQIQSPRTFQYSQAVEGCQLILWGLFKKVVIADSIASIIDPLYLSYPYESGFTMLICVIGFSFQIYCDFSGYSDIAIGSGKLLGFDVLQNFNRPFLSQNLTEFWRRWHISLSSWLNDYLFSPLWLAWRHKGRLGVVAALFITFFISGLWHGAGWAFIVFGCLHGLAVIAEVLTRRSRKAWRQWIPGAIYKVLGMVFTFGFATFAWIFFRAHTMEAALGIISKILLGLFKGTSAFEIYYWSGKVLPFVFLMLLLDWLISGKETRLSFPMKKLPRYAVYSLLFISIYLCFEQGHTQFIYFQF